MIDFFKGIGFWLLFVRGVCLVGKDGLNWLRIFVCSLG